MTTQIYAPAIMMPTITPWHWESIGADLAGLAGGSMAGGSSATWPVDSMGLYVPFVLQQRVVIGQLFAVNGAAAGTGDNVDLGIYTDDFRRLVSLGLTAHAGANAIQVNAVTATSVGPGRFYMALSVDGTSATFIARVPSAPFLQATGCFQEDLSGSGGALPAIATPATVASAYLPAFGIGQAGFTF